MKLGTLFESHAVCLLSKGESKLEGAAVLLPVDVVANRFCGSTAVNLDFGMAFFVHCLAADFAAWAIGRILIELRGWSQVKLLKFIFAVDEIEMLLDFLFMGNFAELELCFTWIVIGSREPGSFYMHHLSLKSTPISMDSSQEHGDFDVRSQYSYVEQCYIGTDSLS